MTEEERAPIAADELVFQQKVMAGSVIRSFAFSRTPSEAHVLLSLVDNQLLLMELSPTESKKIGEVSRPGHPSDVRALALSSDGNQLVSTSQSTHAFPERCTGKLCWQNGKCGLLLLFGFVAPSHMGF